jgi:hypothetical protein
MECRRGRLAAPLSEAALALVASSLELDETVLGAGGDDTLLDRCHHLGDPSFSVSKLGLELGASAAPVRGSPVPLLRK